MMKQNKADKLAKSLMAKFGLGVTASVTSDSNGRHIVIRPVDIHPYEGFSIDVIVGWRSLKIDFIPGKFAADLLNQMSLAPMERKHVFSVVAHHIMKKKGTLMFVVNGQERDPLQPAQWPAHWKGLSLSLKMSPLEINTDNHILTEHLINTWVERFYGCVVSIIPLESVDETDNDIAGLPEGALKKTIVNRYERSRLNRSICLSFHGTTCKVCLTDFEKVYGEIGAGFIHVHHTIPVSNLSEGYVFNPVEDLVPVCPNCHAMLHKRDPPYSIGELKEILERSRPI